MLWTNMGIVLLLISLNIFEGNLVVLDNTYV